MSFAFHTTFTRLDGWHLQRAVLVLLMQWLYSHAREKVWLSVSSDLLPQFQTANKSLWRVLSLCSHLLWFWWDK